MYLKHLSVDCRLEFLSFLEKVVCGNFRIWRLFTSVT